MTAANPSLAPLNKTIVRAFNLRAARLVGGLLARIAPVWTGRGAAALFTTPARSPMPDVPAHLIATASRLSVEVEGRRLAVWAWGNLAAQPRVLLVHGWSGRGLQLHAFVEPLLAAGYAVVAFDQVAHGESDGTRATLPRFARAIHAVASRFGSVDAIVAHSFGAAATAFALQQGMPVARVVLVAPPADLARVTRRFSRTIGLTRRALASMLAHLRRTEGVEVEALAASRLVSRLATPALVIHDIGDGEVPWGDGEQYALWWPRARMISTSGLGHRRILRDATVVDTAVRWVRGEEVGQPVVGTFNLAPMF